jgi:hypothetical protein
MQSVPITTQAIQHFVKKFASDLRQVDDFFLCTPVSSTNKIDRYDITEILLKVVLLLSQFS